MRSKCRRVKNCRKKKIHSRKLHRTIVENYLWYIDLQRVLPEPGSKCTIDKAKVWNGRIWHICTDAKRLPVYRTKNSILKFFTKSCLIHTFFHIFAKIAYFALGVTVWNRRLPNIHTGGHLQSSKKTSIEQHVCIDKNNFLGVLLVVLWRGCLLFLLSGPPSLLCSDERDFQFWTQSCLEPFQKN